MILTKKKKKKRRKVKRRKVKKKVEERREVSEDMEFKFKTLSFGFCKIWILSLRL